MPVDIELRASHTPWVVGNNSLALSCRLVNSFPSSKNPQYLDLKSVHEIRSATVKNRNESPADAEMAPTQTMQNEQNQNTKTDGKRVQVVVTAHASSYKIECIVIGGMHFVQSPSRNVWSSRPFIVTALIGYLSTQTITKLYLIALRDLSVYSPQRRNTNLNKLLVYFSNLSTKITCYHCSCE